MMSDVKEDPVVEEANRMIVEVLKEMRTFLLAKNRDYQGSAFKDITFGGNLILADTTINVRIVDKLRRLQSNSLSFESLDDTLMDLAGYIIIKRALAKLTPKVEEKA
jgi:hypothetical protein